MEPEFDKIFDDIKKQYLKLKNSNDKESFILKLKSFAKFNEEPNDYKEPEVINFPELIHLAYAVCHPECGVEEYIVDGSTQVCQRCGSLMYRTEVAKYKKEI